MVTTNTSAVGTNSQEHHFATNHDEAGTKSTQSTEVNISKECPVAETSI